MNTFVYTTQLGMQPHEVVTVRDARRDISRILADLQEAGPEAEPVFIGARRRAEGVLISVKSYQELAALRERFSEERQSRRHGAAC